jgi:hypothetical protein
VSDKTPSTPTSPIYADRLSGENFPDATTMINAYLARYALRADAVGAQASGELDSSGYAEVQRGPVLIGINVLADRGVLMVFAPIMAVPVVGREAFFRHLLELSFITTSDAAFAINAPRDEVVLRCLRRLSALDYEEFEDIVMTVGEVAAKWHDVLIRKYGT